MSDTSQLMPLAPVGSGVKVTIELEDGRTFVADGLFGDASIETDIVQAPSDGVWRRFEPGERHFRLHLIKPTMKMLR